MLNQKERLNQVIDQVIENHYEIYNRQPEVRRKLYSHKNVCVFGTGEFFEDCADDEHIERFEYVSDNDATKWGKVFKGRTCLAPKEILEIEDIAVLIMVGEWRTIYEELTEMGIESYPMDWYTTNVYDPHYDDQWFENNRKKIIETIDLFEDEESKEVYVEAICNRIAPELAHKIFNEIKIPGEYFETDLIKIQPDECIVDAGAYIGDCIDTVYKITGGNFEKIYSFELDPIIFQKLEKTASKYDSDKIVLFNAGVSDETATLNYSYVGGEKAKPTQIITIDKALGDSKVTFIKMDVETFELKALEGAKNIIKTQKPKLSISAYHYLSDLWEVPLKIKELNPEYKVYLRHHAQVDWDTNCYAL